MPVIEAQCASILAPHDHRHINQMSMPNQRVRTWRPPLPRLAGGPEGVEAARRVARGGRAAICRQDPPPPRRGTEVSASVRRADLRDASAAPGPEPGTRKDPDPRRRSSRGSGRLRTGLPTRQWRPRDACGLSRLNDFLAPWSQAHLPSCTRQVTPTSVHLDEPGPATAPRGHAPLEQAHCL